MITAVVADADRDSAAQQAQEAELAQGVWVSPSTNHGIRDIFIRTEIPNAIWFDATIDRMANGLKLLGDTSNHDVRRGRAVGVIAQPQTALNLFNQAAAVSADDSSSDAALNDAGDVRADVPGEAFPPDADDTTADRSVGSVASTDGSADGAASSGATTGKSRRVDPRPPATLHIHLSADVLGGDSGGVARMEDVGPILTEQARRWLGHCHVTMQPVIDLNNTPSRRRV